jgi:hypothetical protein
MTHATVTNKTHARILALNPIQGAGKSRWTPSYLRKRGILTKISEEVRGCRGASGTTR